MRGRRHKLQVSTFPFLAVLLCAMGSLILVLLVMDRKAHKAAQARAQREAARLAEESAQNATARQAERDKKRQEIHAKLTAEQMELELQMKKVRDEFRAIAARLRYEQDANTQLRHKIQDERGRLQGEKQALTALRGSAESTGTQAEKSNRTLERMTADLLQMERVLKDLRAARERQKHTFSVIPYHGRRGESRRPIYVECTASGVIFHPERRAMSVTSREFLLGRDQPGETPDDVRAEVERRIARQRGQQGGTTNATPYLLLLVRPDGINTYTQFQAVLRDMPIEFGYEFIDGDWVLDFPSDDDQPRAQPWMTAANPTPPAAPIASSATPTAIPRPVHLSPNLVGGPVPAGADPRGFRFGQGGPVGMPGDPSNPPRQPGDFTNPPHQQGYMGGAVAGGSGSSYSGGGGGSYSGGGSGGGGSYSGGTGTGSVRGSGHGHPSALAPTSEGDGVGSGTTGGGGTAAGGSGGSGGSGAYAQRGGGGTSVGGSFVPGSSGSYGSAAAGLGTPRTVASSSAMGNSGGSGPGSSRPGTPGINGSGSPGSGLMAGSHSSGSSVFAGAGPGGSGSGSSGWGNSGLNGSGTYGNGLAAGSNVLGSPGSPGSVPDGRYAIARGNGADLGGQSPSREQTYPSRDQNYPSRDQTYPSRDRQGAGSSPLPNGRGSGSSGAGSGPLPNGRGSDGIGRGSDGIGRGADGIGRGTDGMAGTPGVGGPGGSPAAASAPAGAAANGDRVVVVDDPLLPKSAASSSPAQPPPEGQPRDPPPEETNRNRGPPRVRYVVGNRGAGEGGDPESAAMNRFAPPVVAPARKPRPAGLHPAWLHGGRDWYIYVECLADGVVLYPAGRTFTLTQATSEASINPLVAALKQMIARRQSARRPGDPPFYPHVRLLVRPEYVKTFLLVYPALDAVPATKSRRNLDPDDNVDDIVRGINP